MEHRLRSQLGGNAVPVFPKDIWNEISKEFDLRDFLSLGESCKSLYGMFNQNAAWKDLSLRKWPRAYAPEIQQKDNPFFWKEWYSTQSKIEKNIRSANVELYEFPSVRDYNWTKILESPYDDDVAYCYFSFNGIFSTDLMWNRISSSNQDNFVDIEPSLQSNGSFNYAFPVSFVDVDYEKVVLVNSHDCVVMRNTPLIDGTPLDYENATKFTSHTGGLLQRFSVKDNMFATASNLTPRLDLWDLNTGQLFYSKEVSDFGIKTCEMLTWQTESNDNQNVVAVWKNSDQFFLCIYDHRQPNMEHPVITFNSSTFGGPLFSIRNHIFGTCNWPRRAHAGIKLYDLRRLPKEKADFAEIVLSSPTNDIQSFAIDPSLTRVIVACDNSLGFYRLHKDCYQVETLPSWAWKYRTEDQTTTQSETKFYFGSPKSTRISQMYCTSKYISIISKGDGTRAEVISLASDKTWKDFPVYNNEPLPKRSGVSNAEMFYKIAEKRVNSGRLYFDLGTLLEGEEDSYSDMQIVTTDKTFGVHRCILAARSPVLRQMIKQIKTQPPKLEWFDAPSSVYHKILQWIYTGHCSFVGSVEEQCLLLKYAHEFQLKKLEEDLLAEMSKPKCAPPLKLAVDWNVTPLLDLYIKQLDLMWLTKCEENELFAIMKRMSQLQITNIQPGTDSMEVDYSKIAGSGPDRFATYTYTVSKYDKTQGVPKRNKSAYMFFCEANRQAVKDANPQDTMTDISKKLGMLWKGLDDQKKRVFEHMAQEDKQRYENEKKEYENS